MEKLSESVRAIGDGFRGGEIEHHVCPLFDQIAADIAALEADLEKLDGYRVAFEADAANMDEAQKKLGARHLGKTYLRSALDEIAALEAEVEGLRYDAETARLEGELGIMAAERVPGSGEWFAFKRDYRGTPLLMALPPQPSRGEAVRAACAAVKGE